MKIFETPEFPEATKDNQELQTPIEANNDNQEVSLDIQAHSTALILEGVLRSPQHIEHLTAQIESNPKLAKKLGLQDLDHIALETKIAQTIDKLQHASEGLVMMAELIAIILVNPKGLIKAYKKFGLVVTQNEAILNRIDQELDAMTSDENKLKVAAGYLGKLVNRANPTRTGSALVSKLSRLLGVVSEEEYAKMEATTDLLETPTLNLWMLFELIKNNPDLAESIYQTATQAHTEYKQSKAA